MEIEQFEDRKRKHIHYALDPRYQATQKNSLEQIHLIHEALPDLNFDTLCLETQCLGKSLLTPFYIAGMTAGHPSAASINRVLALACQKRGWVMGLGSQRRDLEDPQVEHWRHEVPDLCLLANIGLSQAIQVGVTRINQLAKAVSAQALVIHCNALQEVLQPEGTPQFQGGLEFLKRCCEESSYPIILKETGCGFSKRTLERLAQFHLAALDVSGLGGTHWGRIEGARALKYSLSDLAAKTFWHWGESTVDSVLAAVDVFEGRSTEIWASGGVRSGLDAAKLIVLGAHRIGYAQPALKAALKGQEVLEQWMALQEFELKIALFCTGTAHLAGLRKRNDLWIHLKK